MVDKDKIIEIINKLRDKAHFGLMEDFPEDLTESKTSWDELEDSYKELYYAITEIESIVKTKDETREPNQTEVEVQVSDELHKES